MNDDVREKQQEVDETIYITYEMIINGSSYDHTPIGAYLRSTANKCNRVERTVVGRENQRSPGGPTSAITSIIRFAATA